MREREEKAAIEQKEKSSKKALDGEDDNDHGDRSFYNTFSRVWLELINNKKNRRKPTKTSVNV